MYENIAYNKGMSENIALEDLSKEELFEIAMVLFNVNESLHSSPKTKSLTLKADYRNYDNPYWVALWPYLTHIDGMTDDTIEGNDVALFWSEENVLKHLSELGVLSFKPNTVRVEDLFETGRAGVLTESYSLDVNTDRFEKLYKQVTDLAETKLLVPAELSFIKVSTPLITSNEQRYELPAMRDGNAFIIVHYCYENFLGKLVSLEELKKELPISGVTNINQALKNSPFDPNNGTLRAFVESEPKIIKVNKSAFITKRDYYALVSISKK